MKKILNRKFLVGFLFVFVVGVVLTSVNIYKTSAGGTLAVSMWASDVIYGPGVTTATVHWSSPAGSTCDDYGGGASGDFAISINDTTTYSIGCSKADSPAPVAQASCTGTIPGSCGPNYQEINCNNLRENNCESLGCIWYGGRWSGDTGYCTNQQYMMCSDMQNNNDCNLGGCSWDPPVSGSCSSISDSSTCIFTSGCTWQ